jgi:hypothetical protein
VEPDYARSAEYTAFWNKLARGIRHGRIYPHWQRGRGGIASGILHAGSGYPRACL